MSRSARTGLASGSGASVKRRWNATRDHTHLTQHAIRHLAERVAGHSVQSTNEQHPLLSSTLPSAERFQRVVAPAMWAGSTFAIRKQVSPKMCLDDYRKLSSFERAGQGTSSAIDHQLREHVDAARIEASSGWLGSIFIERRTSPIISDQNPPH